MSDTLEARVRQRYGCDTVYVSCDIDGWYEIGCYRAGPCACGDPPNHRTVLARAATFDSAVALVRAKS